MLSHRATLGQRSRGFTLLELMLVLGLVVAMAAVSWPALQNPLGNMRLRDAARTVRNQVVHARLAAMRSGQPHGIWAEAGAGRLDAAPLADDANVELIPASEFLAGGAAPPSAPAVESPRLARYRSRETLPAGIVFVEELVEPPPEANATAEDSPPPGRRRLVWQPDGSGDDAEFDLRDDRGRRILVWVRGMTGSVSISQPELIPELLP